MKLRAPRCSDSVFLMSVSAFSSGNFAFLRQRGAGAEKSQGDQNTGFKHVP